MYDCKPNIFGSKIWPFFSYFGSLSDPSLTCERDHVHTITFPHTTVLNGTRTGRLFKLISPWRSFKRFWKAIERKCATAVERMQILKISRKSSVILENKKIKEKLYCCDIIRDFLRLSPLTPAVVQMDRLKRRLIMRARKKQKKKPLLKLVKAPSYVCLLTVSRRLLNYRSS